MLTNMLIWIINDKKLADCNLHLQFRQLFLEEMFLVYRVKRAYRVSGAYDLLAKLGFSSFQGLKMGSSVNLNAATWPAWNSSGIL